MKSGDWWGVVLLVCVTACGGNDPKPTNDIKSGGQGNAGTSGNGDTALCGNASTARAVKWDERTSLGTPSDVFAALAGTCSATVSWDAKSFDNLVVSPSSGSSDLTVTVTVDESTAKFTPLGEGFACVSSLQVDARVDLASKDGTFKTSETTTVTYQGGIGGDAPMPIASFSFAMPLSDLDGSLSIVPKDKGTGVDLSVEVTPVGGGCAGTIRLDTSMALPGGHGGSGASGNFARWTSTGCDTGLVPVPLDTPEQPITSAIATAWTGRQYAGTWDDGSSTNLTVNVGELPAMGCKDEQGTVQFPVTVTYASSDGRLESHSAPAMVNVLGVSPTSSQLEVNTNEELACDAANSSLAYTPADCSQLSRITIQLSINYDTRFDATPGGNVAVYEYGKNADPELTMADSVQTLRFTPAP